MSILSLNNIGLNYSIRDDEFDFYVATILDSQSGPERPTLIRDINTFKTYFGSDVRYIYSYYNFIHNNIPILALPILTDLSAYNKKSLRISRSNELGKEEEIVISHPSLKKSYNQERVNLGRRIKKRVQFVHEDSGESNDTWYVKLTPGKYDDPEESMNHSENAIFSTLFDEESSLTPKFIPRTSLYVKLDPSSERFTEVFTGVEYRSKKIDDKCYIFAYGTIDFLDNTFDSVNDIESLEAYIVCDDIFEEDIVSRLDSSEFEPKLDDPEKYLILSIDKVSGCSFPEILICKDHGKVEGYHKYEEVEVIIEETSDSWKVTVPNDEEVNTYSAFVRTPDDTYRTFKKLSFNNDSVANIFHSTENLINVYLLEKDNNSYYRVEGDISADTSGKLQISVQNKDLNEYFILYNNIEAYTSSSSTGKSSFFTTVTLPYTNENYPSKNFEYDLSNEEGISTPLYFIIEIDGQKNLVSTSSIRNQIASNYFDFYSTIIKEDLDDQPYNGGVNSYFKDLFSSDLSSKLSNIEVVNIFDIAAGIIIEKKNEFDVKFSNEEDLIEGLPGGSIDNPYNLDLFRKELLKKDYFKDYYNGINEDLQEIISRYAWSLESTNIISDLTELSEELKSLCSSNPSILLKGENIIFLRSELPFSVSSNLFDVKVLESFNENQDKLCDLTESSKILEAYSKIKGENNYDCKLIIRKNSAEKNLYDLEIVNGELIENFTVYTYKHKNTPDYAMSIGQTSELSKLVSLSLFDYRVAETNEVIESYTAFSLPEGSYRSPEELELPEGEFLLLRTIKEFYTGQDYLNTLYRLQESGWYPDFLLVDQLNFENNAQVIESINEVVKSFPELGEGSGMYTQAMVCLNKENIEEDSLDKYIISEENRLIYFYDSLLLDKREIATYYPYIMNLFEGDFLKKINDRIITNEEDTELFNSNINNLLEKGYLNYPLYNNLYYYYKTIKEISDQTSYFIIRFIASKISRCFLEVKNNLIGDTEAEIQSYLSLARSKALRCLPLLYSLKIENKFDFNHNKLDVSLNGKISRMINKELKYNITLNIN